MLGFDGGSSEHALSLFLPFVNTHGDPRTTNRRPPQRTWFTARSAYWLYHSDPVSTSPSKSLIGAAPLVAHARASRPAALLACFRTAAVASSCSFLSTTLGSMAGA